MVGGGQSSSASTRALRNAAAGEIVEVQGGGRIMRSTAGRKDRHSKVCTARGPRDRRVRLAAHTAIQFYDVQDRLGYDRPSKAVDWLMKKAQSAIEALNHPPGSNPTATATATATTTTRSPDGEAYDSSLLPPSMESDSIADTIKSFFPMGGEGSSTASMQFQSYQSSDLLAGRDSNQSQDLKLSLQSFQDPIMIQSHQNQEEEQQSQFPGAAQIGFDNSSGGWNFASAGYGGGGGLMFIQPQASLQQHQVLFGHGGGGGNTGHFFTQGGPLQSNYTPLATAVSSQVHHHHDPSVSGMGLTSSAGFSSFRIPARIQGDEEEQHGNPNKPFTLSSGSRH